MRTVYPKCLVFSILFGFGAFVVGCCSYFSARQRPFHIVHRAILIFPSRRPHRHHVHILASIFRLSILSHLLCLSHLISIAWSLIPTFIVQHLHFSSSPSSPHINFYSKSPFLVLISRLISNSPLLPIITLHLLHIMQYSLLCYFALHSLERCSEKVHHNILYFVSSANCCVFV